MRYLASTLAVLATALWLGGLVALAVFAMAIFTRSGLDRETAGRATSVMFVWFGRLQLAFAAVALIAAFLGYLQKRGRPAVILFVLLALATVAAVGFNTYFVPRLEELRLAGEGQSPTFHALHKQSERLMSAAGFILLAAALALPAFCRASTPPQRDDSLDSAAT